MKVRLLCNTAALTEFLPDLLGPFLARHPHVDVELQESSSAEIVRRVAAGTADIGVAADSVDNGCLETRPFRIDQLVTVVPDRHPLAGGESVGFSDLLRYPFVGLTKGSALQDHLDSHAERLGTRIGYRVRVHDFTAVCRLVEEEAGIAIVPETSALRCGRSMAIRHIPLADVWARRQLTLCARDFAALPLHTRHLLDALSD